MKKFKRVSKILFSLTLIFTLAACQKNNGNVINNSKPEENISVQENLKPVVLLKMSQDEKTKEYSEKKFAKFMESNGLEIDKYLKETVDSGFEVKDNNIYFEDQRVFSLNIKKERDNEVKVEFDYFNDIALDEEDVSIDISQDIDNNIYEFRMETKLDFEEEQVAYIKELEKFGIEESNGVITYKGKEVKSLLEENPINKFYGIFKNTNGINLKVKRDEVGKVIEIVEDKK